MNTGEEMANYTQKTKKPARSRGRPSRHESETMKTIAWYHFLAGNKRPADMAEWFARGDIDQATIYRYRRGQISPGEDMLNTDDAIFRAAREVYQTGPLQVALWDALWGRLLPTDFRMADKLMPGGEWPSAVVNEWFFEDAILARIIAFRDAAVREDSVTADLKVFAAALRVFRAWGVLGDSNPMAMRVLLEGTMALPGSRGLLEQYGLIEPMRKWIASQFYAASALNAEPVYWAPWMNDDEEFARQCQLAHACKLQVRSGLLGGRGEGFGREVITDRSPGDAWH